MAARGGCWRAGLANGWRASVLLAYAWRERKNNKESAVRGMACVRGNARANHACVACAVVRVVVRGGFRRECDEERERIERASDPILAMRLGWREMWREWWVWWSAICSAVLGFMAFGERRSLARRRLFVS